MKMYKPPHQYYWCGGKVISLILAISCQFSTSVTNLHAGCVDVVAVLRQRPVAERRELPPRETAPRRPVFAIFEDTSLRLSRPPSTYAKISAFFKTIWDAAAYFVEKMPPTYYPFDPTNMGTGSPIYGMRPVWLEKKAKAKTGRLIASSVLRPVAAREKKATPALAEGPVGTVLKPNLDLSLQSVLRPVARRERNTIEGQILDALVKKIGKVENLKIIGTEAISPELKRDDLNMLIRVNYTKDGRRYSDIAAAAFFKGQKRFCVGLEDILRSRLAKGETGAGCIDRRARIPHLLVIYPHKAITRSIQIGFRDERHDGAEQKVRKLFLFIPELNMFKPIDAILTELIQREVFYIPGNLMEVKFNDTGICAPKLGNIKTPEFWANWQRTERQPAPVVYSDITYKIKIDPFCAAEIQPLIGRLKKDFGYVVLLDIFAGSGDFVNLVYEMAAPGLDIWSYLIEKDPRNVEHARDLLKGYMGRERVIQAELGEGKDEVLRQLRSRPNLVTSIGGINNTVVTREDAFAIARQVYEILPEGGIFVVSGLSICHLDKDDFESIGFRVERMTVSEHVLTGLGDQFYVLVKPVSERSLSQELAGSVLRPVAEAEKGTGLRVPQEPSPEVRGNSVFSQECIDRLIKACEDSIELYSHKIVLSLRRGDIQGAEILFDAFFKTVLPQENRTGLVNDAINNAWQYAYAFAGPIEKIRFMKPEIFAKEIGVIEAERLDFGLFVTDPITIDLIRRIRAKMGDPKILWRNLVQNVLLHSPEQAKKFIYVWRLHPYIDRPGIYYSKSAPKDRRVPLSKTILFHELLEAKFISLGVRDVFFLVVFGHAHPRIAEEELKFAALMHEVPPRIAAWRKNIEAAKSYAAMPNLRDDDRKKIYEYIVELEKILSRYSFWTYSRPLEFARMVRDQFSRSILNLNRNRDLAYENI